MSETLPPLIWNLFLAAVPAGLAYALTALLRRAERAPWLWPVAALLALAWLAFLPNASYAITEWRRLFQDPMAERFFHAGGEDRPAMIHTVRWTAFYAAYTGLGALLFGLAVRPVKRWLREHGVFFVCAAPVLFALVSLGVYLGYVVRFNSWDLLLRPQVVIRTAYDAIHDRALLGGIMLYGALLWAVFEAVDVWADGALLRLQRIRPLDGEGEYSPGGLAPGDL